MWAPHVTTASSSAVVMESASSTNDVQKQKQSVIVNNNAEIITPNCNERPLIYDNTNRNLNFTNNQNILIPTQETIVDIPTAAEDLQQLIDEMRLKDFDSIRFATYRTACKLRFVQTKTNVHLVDIWNMIESFRENGLNAIPTCANLKISRVELLLTSIFHNLNKRLPTTQQIDTDKSISMLLSFLIGVYDRQNIGRLTIFSIKVGLATLCAGKLVDKLRYIFSQISDSSGIMEYEKFADYLQQVLALPSAVFEAPTFGFNETALLQCFKREDQINLNNFLDVIISDSCPPCLMWLPLLHRMASVEHVYHPVVCDACQIRSFTGFRYKCQRCPNYQLCQSCFWRGRTSQTHSNEHEMKEYSSYKSPTKQIAHSIQKSLQCMPMQQTKTHKTFPIKPQRMLDLTNIVPVTPTALRHQVPEQITDWTTNLLPGQYSNGNTIDDEHKLIARYAAKLAGRTSFPLTSKYVSPRQNDALEEHALITQLEEENNEMLREIAILEQQQNMSCSNGQLNGLREQTKELEEKMRKKQQLRRQLMQQLEQLMAQLNNTQGKVGQIGNTDKVYSVMSLTNGVCPEELNGIRNVVSNAFRNGRETENVAPVSFANINCTVGVPASQLQGNLLQAANEITSNMNNLVLELNQANEENDDSSNIKKNHTKKNENVESFK